MQRIIFGVFGCVFACIGVLVISWMWLAPFGEFHSPPLVFRIFASLIAIPFIAMGGGFAYGAITGKMFDQNAMLQKLQEQHRAMRDEGASSATLEIPVRNQCPACAAPLEDGSDVSPSGDVKCKHCGKWYNVHNE